MGLQLGIGKRFNIKGKSNIDLIGGALTRWILKGDSGSSGGGCGDVLCARFLADEEYTIDRNIHASLYTKASWPFYSSNENNFGVCLTLIYTQGLHSVYRNYTNIRFLQENTEYNYGLENRGSFFGIGLSLNFKRSFVSPLFDWF